MDRNSPPPEQRKKRFTLVDLLLFSALAALILYAGYRVNDVLVYHWNWSRVLGFLVKYDQESESWVANLLLQGLATTLRLAIWATVFATLVGVVMGYWRTCQNLALRIISRCYVELIRNIPPIVFIFIFYFFVSSQLFPAIGIYNIDRDNPWVANEVFAFLFGDPALLDNFLAGMICLSLFEGAYITEIVRAGIQSTPKGQWEAARSIGLSPFNVLRDIILPQAVRKILPPLAGTVHHPDQGFGHHFVNFDSGTNLCRQRSGRYHDPGFRNLDPGRGDVFRALLQLRPAVRPPGTARKAQPALTPKR